MSYYSNDPAMVRVDFWKESGKWYATEQIEFAEYNDPDMWKVLEEGIRKKLTRDNGRIAYAGMRATCLAPYHVHSHPISLIVPER